MCSTETRRDLLICQVDLFPSRGDLPTSMMAAAEREKDIRYLQPHAHEHGHGP
jgi:NTE family protein